MSALKNIDFNDLPTGWVLSTLGEYVAKRSRGIVPDKTPDDTFELYSVPSHENNRPEIVQGKEIGSNKQLVEEDTVLLCKINPRINRTWVVGNHSSHQNIASTEWIAFPPCSMFEPRYLAYYMRQHTFREFLAGNASGVGGSLMRVKPATITDYPFPIAPLNQQTRIVAEIEKQFSRLDEAVANLKRVKANLKRYKAAVLKAAVEGKLTEEWRKNRVGAGSPRPGRDDRAPTQPIETGAELLQRILAERREKWQGRGKYKEPVAPDTNGLPELPEGWVWASVDHFAFVTKLAGFEYTKFVKYDSAGDLAVIKAENAGKDGFKKTEYSKIKSETVAHLTRSMVKAGDLLMVFVGAGTGQVARVPDGQPYFLGPNVGMIRVESERVLPAYLEHYLRSPVGNQIALGFAKAVAQPSLSMGAIRMIAVPIPPLAEQHQIVAEVERRLSIVAGAEAQVDANLRRAGRLRQSILKQAFSGKLVPQDENDEPASVQIDRVRDDVRAIHESPLPKPQEPTEPKLPLVAESNATYGDDIAARILAAMQPGREYARADLADPLGLTTGQWSAAILELKLRGQVRQVGEKRGPRYFLWSD